MIVLFVILSLLVLFLVFRFYLGLQEKKRRNLGLIVIRLLIFIVLTLSFLQPQFNIKRLLTTDDFITILIDASESMQLFSLDTLITVLESHEIGSSNRSQKPSFRLFLFGDSLRSIQNTTAIVTTDNNSHFPQVFNKDGIKKSKTIIIISDGNWTNSISPNNFLANKERYYIPLKQINRYSSITLGVPKKIFATVSERDTSIQATISGFKKSHSPVSITATMNNEIIYQHSIPLDSGLFLKKVDFLLPVKKAGIFHVKFLVENIDDSLSTIFHSLYTVKKKTFTVFPYAQKPSLDKRFFVLSMKKNRTWKIVSNVKKNNAIDLLLFFDWNDQARDILKQYPFSTTAYIGCLPDTKQSVHAIDILKPPTLSGKEYITAPFLTFDYPPLSSFMTNHSPNYRITRELFWIDSITPVSGSVLLKVPLLFEAEKNKKHSLVIAFKGIWRWDFWSKSVDNTAQNESFTNICLNYLSSMVQNNTNNTFYVFPDLSPVYSGDSIPFHLSLPSHFHNLTTLKSTLFILAQNNDTLFTWETNHQLFRTQTISLTTPPLPVGKYRYSCQVQTEMEVLTYTDSIEIFKDNSELTIDGQNELLLGDNASKLDFEQLSSFMQQHNSTEKKANHSMDTIIHTIHLNRNWLLLGVLLFLFTIEWYIRRLWKLD